MKITIYTLSIFLFLAEIFSTGCKGNGNSSKGTETDSDTTWSEEYVEIEDSIVPADEKIIEGTFVGLMGHKCDSIWRTRSDFDMKLYLSQLSDVYRWETNKKINNDEAHTLRNHVRENAINVACKGYNRAIDVWTSRSEHMMSLNLEGLRKIKADFSVNYPKITEIEKIDTLYKTICSFVRGIKITPKFDGYTWKSFYRIRDEEIGKAERLSKNALFSRLKDIPVVTDSLDVDKLTEIINGKNNKNRNEFYRQLESKIEAYYKAKLPWSENDLQQLNGVIYKKLNNELSTSGTKLWNFIEANKTND